MPRRGGLPLFCFVAVRLYFVAVRSGYQQGSINKGRSPQNCMACGCVSVRPSNAILRDDGLICFAPLRTSLSVLGAGGEAPRLLVASSREHHIAQTLSSTQPIIVRATAIK